MAKSITLTGGLTWDGSERRSNRYGGIMLCTSVKNWADQCPSIDLSPVEPFVGKRVKLSAKVIESHKSCHVGDQVRHILPSQTPVDSVVDLGVGTIVEIGTRGDWDSIIFCRDGREKMSDWMDPNILYRLHDHLVELMIEDASGIPFTPSLSEGEQMKGNRDGFIAITQPDPEGGSYVQMKETFSHG